MKGDLKLRDQLGAASERAASVIAEGFSQSTDRHFASYLYRSRGSSNEIRTQLKVALKRGYITEDEQKSLADRYEEIAKMLTGLIAYLLREDRKNRPRFCTQNPAQMRVTADCRLLTVDWRLCGGDSIGRRFDRQCRSKH